VHERERDDAMTASILVVDDESTTQDTLGFFLEAEGYPLMGYEWQGNVRELEHVLEQAMILGDGDLVGLHQLPGDLEAGSSTTHPRDLREAVRLFSRRHVLDVLARAGHDKRRAAHLLGISLASLYRKLDVEPPDLDAAE
jgi:transcriptional regulator with PAS, ATPase and Fis domain